MRRTLRIFPLYYGVFLLLLLLTPVMHWSWSASWLAWPLYVGNWLGLAHAPANSPVWLAEFGSLRGYFHGQPVTARVGHFWSLCVEEQFYLLWPWVVFHVRSRKALLWICVLSLPICLGLRAAGVFWTPDLFVRGSLFRLTLTRIDSLTAGALVALVLRGPSAARWLAFGRRFWTTVFLLAFAWAFLLPPRALKWHLYPMPGWTYWVTMTPLALMSALLLLNLLEGTSLWSRALRNRPLRYLGRLSYGLYVFHDIPHDFYQRAAHGLHGAAASFVTAGVAFLGTFALAWMSFRWVESPFLNLKERLTVRAPKPSPQI